MIHHYILTRFNLRLWKKDKNGEFIEPNKWLEDRIVLFENYCLPSVIAQTCQDFVWILLVDADTPERYLRKINSFKDRCPQISLVFLKSEFGFKFVDVFPQIVRKHLSKVGVNDNDLCLTTYFDNDDVLAFDYVEDVQNRAMACQYGSFISYDYGCQFFSELSVASRIFYPNNHFMTLVENVKSVRTCYGYGSHFLVEKNRVAKVIHVTDKLKPMWMEIIHKCNVDNDVKMTFDTSLLNVEKSKDVVRRFSIKQEQIHFNRLPFYWRCLKQIYRRAHDKIFPRVW